MLVLLTDISIIKDDLLNEVIGKIAAGDVLSLNSNIDSYLTIDAVEIKALLSTIELKLRSCEEIYYTYLKNVDHAMLCGTAVATSKVIDVEFSYGTKVIKTNVDINEKEGYVDLINIHFQNFVITICTLYENLVRLTEMLIKKIIIHSKGKRPVSAPYPLLLEYWKMLIALSYRGHDNFFTCVNAHDVFLTKYSLLLNSLRNRAVHGYNSSLYPDGGDYKVICPLNSCPLSDPELILDVFSQHVFDNTKNLVIDFINALITDIKVPGQKIPM